MGFQTSCFIQKCNKEIINKLLNLGYKAQGQYETLKYGIFCNNGKFKICSTNEQPSAKDKDFIQCYNNEDLFFALAAMRDDSDYMQWFIIPETKTIQLPGCFPQTCGLDGRQEKVVGHFWHQHLEQNNKITERMEQWREYGEPEEILARKATVEEIIEHFK